MAVGHPLRDVIQETRELVVQDWDLEILQSYKEALTCADSMSKVAQKNDMDLHMVLVPPDYCISLLQEDIRKAQVGAPASQTAQ